MPDVLLTGPPRSGTTLACELLNEADDTVALDEPLPNELWPVHDRSRLARALRRPAISDDAFCDAIAKFLDDTRSSIAAGRGALTLNYGGRVTGSKFPDAAGDSGLREEVTRRSFMPVDKPLSPDFILACKHNAGFTAMVGALAKRFPTYAIVRNPLSTLSSWQTVSVPVSDGHIPRGEQIDLDLQKQLEATADTVDRQFVILRWFFDAFRTHLPDDAVIRYEDIISSGGRALTVIAKGASALAAPLESRNISGVYDADKMRSLGRRLLDDDGPWWHYYTRESVEHIMNGGA